MFRIALRGRRRARPHRGGEEEARRRLARDAGAARGGPRAPRPRRARRSTRPTLGEILRRERRQLHPLLRDQRALAGIGRAHANEILLRARLSPFKASTELSDEEVERLAAAMHDDLARGARAARAGQGRLGRLPSSTTGSASRARSAGRRSRASTSRSTRSTTARAARRAAGCSRTAGSRGC